MWFGRGSDVFSDLVQTAWQKLREVVSSKPSVNLDTSQKSMAQPLFCRDASEAQSGELAPASFYAFFRQRMRWTVGWDQAKILDVGSEGSSAYTLRS